MKMYRAVPKVDFIENQIYYGQTTKRIPSNVPYIIDNIWEWLRPKDAPSRRHAIYASPTPELALENASSVGNNSALYVICELVFNDSDIKLAHLNIKDARYHKDISTLMRHVNSYLGKEFSNMTLNEKAKHAALYLPSISKEEMEDYLFNSNFELASSLHDLSTFWLDTTSVPEKHNGELFFELSKTGSYTLHRM